MPKGAKTHSVRGSRSGRPIMALLDLLGRRWALRILWELREQTLTSRSLRAACDEASPTVLQARLSELRQAGINRPHSIERVPADGDRPRIAGQPAATTPFCRALEQVE